MSRWNRCSRSTRAFRYFVASVVCAAPVHAVESQILETSDGSHTAYLAGATAVQMAQPMHGQRGVSVDGTLRSRATFPWMIAGNPFGWTWNDNASYGDVRLDTGTYSLTDVDLALPAEVPWPIARSYNFRQHTGAGYVTSLGYQGNNWFQMSQPELVLVTGLPDGKDIIYLVYGADRYVEFKQAVATGPGSAEFKAKNGAAGMLLLDESTDPETYTYYDQHGMRTVFFGFDYANSLFHGQIWKIVDPDENTAYVGSLASPGAAITSGYTSNGEIQYAYDSAGNLYEYFHVGGLLEKVEASEPNGASWTLVADVDYEYYGSTSVYGSAFDLKEVKIRPPESGLSYSRDKYYRYWTDDHPTDPGPDHALKYILDFEGVRRFPGTNYAGVDDDSIAPFASAYFAYDNEHRISSFWSTGACGCSPAAAADGTHTLDYEANAAYSDDAGYDLEWMRRAVLERPDGAFETQYFDETGQPLSHVLSPGDPDTASDFWVTRVKRDGNGVITERHTPANLASYTHSSGAITSIAHDDQSETPALVWCYTPQATGDMLGFKAAEKWALGEGGTENNYRAWTYTSRAIEPREVGPDPDVAAVAVVRPLPDSRGVYPTTGAAVTTEYDYTFHSSVTTDVERLAVAEMKTTHPAATAGNNGSGQRTVEYVYHDVTGQKTLAWSASGIIDYWEYENGKLVEYTQDADVAPVDLPAGWSVDGTPFERTTLYSDGHDGDGSTLPDGSRPETYISYLSDLRSITLAYPHVDTANSRYYGPVYCIVQNHAGKVEFEAVIGISGGSTTTDQDSHVQEAYSDPIQAVALLGTPTEVVRYRYDSTGTQLKAKWDYFDIDAPGGAGYDETLYDYDTSGRLVSVEYPHGTIVDTVYDAIGRPTRKMVGTFNDPSSGHYDMADMVEVTYDGGALDPVGNGHITVISRDGDRNDTSPRETIYEYDPLGRPVVTVNEEAPHYLRKYDNLGRAIAVGVYDDVAYLDETADPMILAADRVALVEMHHDALGRVWSKERHEVNPSTGALGLSITTDSWFDLEGRLIKQDGEQLLKLGYDRVGRLTDRWVLAHCNDDSGYADAHGVDGDIVLEEQEFVYESVTSDDVVMRIAVDRLYNDYGTGETAGELDTNDYTTSLTVGASGFANQVFERRAQITAYWYDTVGRLETEALYGTNDASGNVGAFTWSTSGAPSQSSASALVTRYAYYDDGRLKSVIDPRGFETRREYSDDGKTLALIRNYVNGVAGGGAEEDEDQIIRYAYTDGLLSSMTADLPDPQADQTTTYTYGVVETSPSQIAAGHLLWKVQYPDSGVVEFAYNMQGERIYRENASGTVLRTYYDDVGRVAQESVTSIPAQLNDDIRRIAYGYDGVGRLATVTQYDHPSAGSVVDEMEYSYDNWGNISALKQDHDSTVAVGGSLLYDVGWSYARATTGRNTLRRTSMTLPDDDVVSYSYASDGGLHDDEASRVTSVLNGTTLAEYQYNGAARCVNTILPQPGTPEGRGPLYRALHNGADTFDALDRFDRLEVDRWAVDLAADIEFYDRDVVYDYTGNITGIDDQLYARWDLAYTVDELDRLIESNGGVEDEAWVLTQSGNWSAYQLDADGDGFYTSAADRKESNVFDSINEWEDRYLDTDDDSVYDDLHYDLDYDSDGQLVDDGENYKYEYDGFGRVTAITDLSSNLVAAYTYNGAGYRTSITYDTDTDGDVDASDLTFRFVYDDQWRVVGTFRGSDTDPKEQVTYHNASLGGRGACASAVDLLICRDRDAGWTSAADGTLEERVYYCQNYRGDVVSVHKSDGELLERVHYSSYGVPFLCVAGDTDQDGDVDQGDLGGVVAAMSGTYSVVYDFNLDGAVSQGDLGVVLANFNSSHGRGMLSSASVQNFFGYAGYRHDEAIDVRSHVRNRMYLSELGRWSKRDPIGYVDGMNLYAYAGSAPMSRVDPSGLNALMEWLGGCLECGTEWQDNMQDAYKGDCARGNCDEWCWDNMEPHSEELEHCIRDCTRGILPCLAKPARNIRTCTKCVYPALPDPDLIWDWENNTWPWREWLRRIRDEVIDEVIDETIEEIIDDTILEPVYDKIEDTWEDYIEPFMGSMEMLEERAGAAMLAQSRRWHY